MSMNNNDTARTAQDLSLELLTELADPKFVEAVRREMGNGYSWMHDPYHEGVIGLVKGGDPQEAIVVVYVYDEDFESAIDWSPYPL